MINNTSFQNWYISHKIPDITFSQIPESLKCFWRDYLKGLSDDELDELIKLYEL